MELPAQALAMSLKGAYRSGWPSPEIIAARVPKISTETIADFQAARARIMREHQGLMEEVVIWAVSNDLYQHMLLLGPLAKEDMPKALYVLGYTDTPPLQKA